MDISVDYLAVLVAAVVAFLAGWLWHSPILFGKLWMRLAGMPEVMTPEMKKEAPKSMILGLITWLITAFVLAHFAYLFGARDVMGALTLGFWVWLGFIVTTMAGSVLWERKSKKLFLFNIVYQLVNIEIMALVIVLWG